MPNRVSARAIGVALFVLAILIVPAVTQSAYFLDVLIRVAFYALCSLGIWLIYTTGLLTAAQASFVGIGAYTSALLATRFGVSPWIGLFGAGAVAAVAALIVGIPALRTRGIYFIFVTFALAEVFRMVVVRWQGLTGGSNGIRNIPGPDSIRIPGLPPLEFDPSNPIWYYYYIWALLAMAVLFSLAVYRSRMGLIFRSIRQSEVLAQCSGINPFRYKLLVFVVTCVFAGIAGSFYAHYIRFVSPEAESFGLSGVFNMLMYLVVGGMGSLAGPVSGALVMTGLGEVLRPFKEYMPIVNGVILVAVIMLMPAGLASLPRKISSAIRRMRSRGKYTSRDSFVGDGSEQTESLPSSANPPEATNGL